jgi:hypothetical protein
VGARGPHDDFESARLVIESAIAALAGGDFETLRELSDPEAEHVTRDGGVRGPERLISEFAPQLDRWVVSFYVEGMIDAGGGAVVVLLEVERRNRETGKVGLKAWPANVMRVHNGRVVFLEGYVDRRRALADLGLNERPKRRD